MEIKLNPLQRLALNGRVLSDLQVPPDKLSILKDIQDKLCLARALEFVDNQGSMISLREDTPAEELELEIKFSRAESDVLLEAINSKKFTVSDYDWLWPLYKALKS